MENKKISKLNIVIISVAVIASVAILIFAFLNNKSKPSVSNVAGKYDNFAQCLSDKGATMYGAEWCPHCKEQKAEFGTSFKLVKYVECPDNIQFCIDKGIQGYPTWIIGTSTKIEGTQTMESLSKAIGCPLP